MSAHTRANEQLRLRLGEELENPKHPMPSDYMPDKNFVKEDKAMFDVRRRRRPLSPISTIARVQRRGTTRRLDMARRPPSMFRARSIRRASGLLSTLPTPFAGENDHALVEAIDKSILNPGASSAAYQRIDTPSTTDPNELKVPVKVIHVHQAVALLLQWRWRRRRAGGAA